MHYNHLYTRRRLGILEGREGDQGRHRHTFQRDFDRLIFSSAFRRLQDKTQVFPLPRGSAFVHNRLTHSLEVASVGRSLGNLVGQYVLETATDLSPESKEFYDKELGAVIAAACLCHDVGNPPFGHSGEDAIARFFAINPEAIQDCSPAEQSDFLRFEGNANAFRVLTSGFAGRREGGMALTLSTLAAIGKYPCASHASEGKKGRLHRQKFGFFATEQSTFSLVASATGMVADGTAPAGQAWQRHPFAYLVEAADDICYRIIDLEDAHRLAILPYQTVCDLLIGLILSLEPGNQSDSLDRALATVSDDDKNERIAVLRARAIGSLLVYGAFPAYQTHEASILAGTHTHSLIDGVDSSVCTWLDQIYDVSVQRIYNHPSVVRIEIAGYKVLGGLLEEFVPALIAPNPKGLDKKVLELLPGQFRPAPDSSAYQRLQAAVDFVSGMTDDFALDLYRRLRGIDV